MQLETLKSLFKTYKESTLSGRYIYSDNIVPLLTKFSAKFRSEIIGNSVLNEPIYTITVGQGPTKVLLWSQMHGNESTTTKALFDLVNFLDSDEQAATAILKSCTLKIIPILNPDGAKAYTRLNANEIDLNRDAQELSQPESVVLRNLFNTYQPDFCFNLHGQRTIFSAGEGANPATLSFLAPAQDSACTLTDNRKIAMSIISEVNGFLQGVIPGSVGIYDDAFNLNCVGDTFQSLNVPTILFEAGHYPEDYDREITRELIFMAYLKALNSIVEINQNHTICDFTSYLEIPQNHKLFYDVIIRNVKLTNDDSMQLCDVAIQFQEELSDDHILFQPKVERIGDLNTFFGHYEMDADGKLIQTEDFETIYEGYYNDFVMLNNERLSLKSANR